MIKMLISRVIACGLLFMVASLPASGDGLSASFNEDSEPLVSLGKLPPAMVKRDSPWSMTLWVKSDVTLAGPVPHSRNVWDKPGYNVAPPYHRQYMLVGGIGNAAIAQGSQRMFIASCDGVGFWSGQEFAYSTVPLVCGAWQFLAATCDGQTVRLYQDGKLTASGDMLFREASPVITLSPALVWPQLRRFVGSIAEFRATDQVIAPEEISRLAQAKPDPSMAVPLQPKLAVMPKPYRNISCPGLLEPQDPRTLPVSKSTPSPVVRKPKVAQKTQPALAPDGRLILNAGWELIEERRTSLEGNALSKPGVDTREWYDATVPGTVLTTLVEQGVYPDPYYGLNNLAIPESLCRQDWWYRTEFTTPDSFGDRTRFLEFLGVNYEAEIWLNGVQLGTLKGIGLRGKYDVSKLIRPNGRNALAVKIIPPPHVGVPVELSLRINNRPCGGWLVLDGPTFFATEHWDWIPGIRDRSIGIWQDVTLSASGGVTLVDPFVKTKFQADSAAALTVSTDLKNHSEIEQKMTLRGTLEGRTFEQQISVPAGGTVPVSLEGRQFPALILSKPRLWWPNGYGEQSLYTLLLEVLDARGRISDRREVRFGVREIAIDIKSGFLVKINGKPIFARGGSWGMDDAMKRVSKARLEPFLRLQHDAGLNMVRLWSGQSIGPGLLELCDEYGIMVWCEFWMTTTHADYDHQDEKLMQANLEDTIRRYRNHPSIVVWEGRNEGNPPQATDDFLKRITADLDGTRYYQPNSNGKGMAGSGPWNYTWPAKLFKDATGFRPEVGAPSVPSADAIRAMMPEADTWPISDTWGYHDFPMQWRLGWAGYVGAVGKQFGPSTNLDEFCLKAQMVNYDEYRAIYESAIQKMFTTNTDATTGISLWMSHPAWPSMLWQLYSWQGDAHGAYFGAKRANEPVHVQMSPLDGTVIVANHRFLQLENVSVTARLFDRFGKPGDVLKTTLNAAPSAVTEALKVPVSPDPKELTYVNLELRNKAGVLISENFYWHTAEPEGLRAMSELPKVKVEATAGLESKSNDLLVSITLHNPATTPAVMLKATVRDAVNGKPILPAFYSDNYVTLLAGEIKTFRVELPGQAKLSRQQIKITLEGWNLEGQPVSL